MARAWKEAGFETFPRLQEAGQELENRQKAGEDVKLFAAETLRGDGETSRVFIVCELNELLDVLRHRRDLRTIHEVPVKGPVRLVVDIDLEWDKYGKQFTGDQIVRKLWEVVAAYAKTLPEFGPDVKIAKKEADASNSAKLSRHGVFEFFKPDSTEQFIFANLFCAGAFMRRCLAQHYKEEPNSPLFFEVDGTPQCVVDTAIWALNHTLRCMGMHKVLEPERPLIFLQNGTRIDEDTCVEGMAALLIQPPGLLFTGQSVVIKEGDGQPARSTNCSIFNYPQGLGRPRAAAFTRQLSTIGFQSSHRGVEALIRSFLAAKRPNFDFARPLKPKQTIFSPIEQVDKEERCDNLVEFDLFVDSPLTLADAIVRWMFQLTQDSSVAIRSEQEDFEISVMIKLDQTKACMIKKDFHKSNHIFAVVNISQARAWIKCHDPDCRRKSVEIEIPPSLRFFMLFAVELRNFYRLVWSEKHSSSVPLEFTVYDTFEPAEPQISEAVCATVFSYKSAPAWQKKMIEAVLEADLPFKSLPEQALKRALDFLVPRSP